ncbi:MAG: hypothetical protein H6585_09955 [Flavobacteriales bacterium]|nr:hypothetical protein [Flavobacteriales bacterium]
MKPKQIKWEYHDKDYYGHPVQEWVGTIEDGSPVRFVIKAVDPGSDEYLIRNDVDGIPQVSCIGLKKARKKAQELFNCYVMSLAVS